MAHKAMTSSIVAVSFTSRIGQSVNGVSNVTGSYPL